MSTVPNPFRYLRYPLLWLIRGYQRGISPLLPPACRFMPTCSEYAYESIAEYGIIKGGRLALWRVLRCNPWGGCGYDPVPPRHKPEAADGHADTPGSESTVIPGAGATCEVAPRAH